MKTPKEFFCDPATITSWADFLEAIDKASEQLKQEEEEDADLWFRGHSAHAYKLLPSLFRHFTDLKGEAREEKLWAVESDFFWEFWARGKELHGVIENDWDILFAMQHYQTPTRLLDWTETLGVAVYFATLNVDEGLQLKLREQARGESDAKVIESLEARMKPHPSVWLLNPYALNRRSIQRDKGEDPGRCDVIAPENLGWRWAKKEDDIPSGE